MSRTLYLTARTAAVLAVALFAGALALAAPDGLDTWRLKGKAHYENDQFEEAAAEFRRCIETAPNSAADHFNLALALMRARGYEDALRALDDAQALDPTLLAVYYIRGIIFKRQGRFEAAAAELEHVVASDPTCAGAYYNLGVCYKALQEYELAVGAFKKKEALTPTDPSTHYQLISLYRHLGSVEDADRHREIFARVRDTVDKTQKTAEALERSRYSYIMDVSRLAGDLAARPDAKVRFVDVTNRAGFSAPVSRDKRGHFGGSVELADYDRDGDLDVYVANSYYDSTASVNRLYRNEGDGVFSEVAEAAGVADGGMSLDAVFGDYDNDGNIDLYVANWGPNTLYRNNGDGTFEDVSKPSRADEPQCGRRALFVDYDHDNDLDIFVANGLGDQSNALLRNNGNGTFADLTDESGLLTSLTATEDAVAADFDGDGDVDLFVAEEPPEFFTNARFGRFEPGGSFSPPIKFGTSVVAEADFNHDGHSDVAIETGGAVCVYLNNGWAEFSRRAVTHSLAVRRVEVLDYNNDGWTDLLVTLAGDAPLRLLAGLGDGEFHDVTADTGLDAMFGEVLDLALGDLDGDGDEDIVVQTGDRGPLLLDNTGAEGARWLHVLLSGKKVNRSAYGATVEVASDGHYQKQTYRKDGAHFGLGDLEEVDVVRVTWPNGVAQNLIGPAVNSTVSIEEHVKVSASCAFLYTYNGGGFELVNEILGIGPLGVPTGAGTYHQPDCTELTKIESHQLVGRGGFYELRLTEELREIAYADQISLRAVDHPADLEVVPNEMFVAPPFPEDKLFAVPEQRQPVSAVDERGADVLDLIRYRDGRFPTFPTTSYHGLARQHFLTLDLGDLTNAKRILLFLDGWIHWPESSTVMAIAQDPRFDISPLALEIRDEDGQWRIAVESVGLPTSKGLVVPLDLTGRFAGDVYQVRLSTTLCVYFDRIYFSTRDEAERCRVTELPVAHADLHYRGFSSMTNDALGFERFDYGEVHATGSWSPPAGLLTRYGDVTPLLARPDDMYVIFGPGDELSLRFDEALLPELPRGWKRDFVFYANGWVKDGDLNTKFSETVGPLPFHGMSGYPYPESENYPDTDELLLYQRTYNTRPSTPTVGVLPASRD